MITTVGMNMIIIVAGLMAIVIGYIALNVKKID